MYFLELACMASTAGFLNATDRAAAIGNRESPYYGLTINAGGYSRLPRTGIVELSYNNPGQTEEFILPRLNEEEEAEPLEDFDVEEAPEEVLLRTCVDESLLEDNFSDLVGVYKMYSRILKAWVDTSEIPFHSFIMDKECDSDGCRDVVKFINKQGGDYPWTNFLGINNRTGLVRQDKFMPADRSTIQDVFDACKWRGGENYHLQMFDPDQLKIVCGPEALNCAYLVSTLTASQQNLYFEDGQTYRNPSVTAEWQNLYYAEGNISHQNEWNRQPYVMQVLSEPNSGRPDLLLAYLRNPETFPTHAEMRSLCVYSASDFPPAKASELLFQFGDDINERNPVDTEQFEQRMDQIQQIVENYNEQKKKEIEELDENNECEPIVVPILSYSTSLMELKEKLGITPEGLALITDDIKVLYSAEIRDNYRECELCVLEHYQRFVGHLKKLENMLPLFLEAGEQLYEIGDEIAKSLPRTSEGLTLIDENDWFGGSYELPIVGTVGGAAGVLGMIALVLLQYLGVTKAMLGRLRGEQVAGWWKCCAAFLKKDGENEKPVVKYRSIPHQLNCLIEDEEAADNRVVVLQEAGKKPISQEEGAESISQLFLNRAGRAPDNRRMYAGTPVRVSAPPLTPPAYRRSYPTMPQGEIYYD